MPVHPAEHVLYGDGIDHADHGGSAWAYDPITALMPATCDELKTAAYQAGELAVKLARSGLTARDIVTKDSFENAIMVHAAIFGFDKLIAAYSGDRT